MDEAATLEALANTLTLLTENPYDLSLHVQHVRLARESGMEDQVEAALDMIVTYWAAGDEVWLPIIDAKIRSTDLETAEGVQTVVELFEKAEVDYLCTHLHCFPTKQIIKLQITLGQRSLCSNDTWSLF